MQSRSQLLPSIDEVTSYALASTADHLRAAPEFTFDMLLVVREYDKNGKVRKSTSTSGETYMSARRNIDIPLAVNGRPRNDKDVTKTREAAVKAMEADARERATYAAKTPPKDTSNRFGSQVNDIRMEPYTILKLCPLSNLRLDTVADRSAYAIDFSACAAEAVPKVPFRHLAGIRGTLWIDRESGVIVLMQSWLATDGPDARPWFENRMQLFPGASPVWLPYRNYYNFTSNTKLFGEHQEIDWIASRPKRFTVETTATVRGTEPSR